MLHRKKWARQYKNQMQSAPEKSNGTLINRKEENTVYQKHLFLNAMKVKVDIQQ